MWAVDDSRRLAEAWLGGLGQRWTHVQAVGSLAEELLAGDLTSEVVASAAWLHDIGYAPGIAETGFHALDGATFLTHAGAPPPLVGLVALHTGARFEAAERGLTEHLNRLPEAPTEDLDVLTLVDLVVSPSGEMTSPGKRLDEVLRRYPEDDPVHRAVKRSRPTLLASVSRARVSLGLPDEWPTVVVQRVGDT